MHRNNNYYFYGGGILLGFSERREKIRLESSCKIFSILCVEWWVYECVLLSKSLIYMNYLELSDPKLFTKDCVVINLQCRGGETVKTSSFFNLSQFLRHD